MNKIDVCLQKLAIGNQKCDSANDDDDDDDDDGDIILCFAGDTKRKAYMFSTFIFLPFYGGEWNEGHDRLSLNMKHQPIEHYASYLNDTQSCV